ncbi:MAG: CDP-alcohol phosphatidyltransferase family protein [Chitinivibrionales bacterium]|nr:CDP-alcohol phosphatidyltransferase family protein [Chitinivibrionales bacterium]MBD3357825.1 CDP-alcohol phosphatidyltransferase family protein [Chitinivibrionales bacterium]
MIEGLKPGYNAFLLPAARTMVRIGVHPNALTIFGVVIYAVAGVYAAVGRWWPSVIAAILGGFLDGLDGLVAREGGLRSRFGAVLDSSCDRLTEIVWFGGLLVYFLRDPHVRFWGALLVFFALAGGIMVSYVKARAEGVGLECKRGLLQRPERLLLFGACLIAGPWMVWGLALLTLLSYITVVQRLLATLASSSRHLEQDTSKDGC